MDEFWEEVKELIADIKIRNFFIRWIMKIAMAPYIVLFLGIWKFMDRLEAWMDGRRD